MEDPDTPTTTTDWKSLSPESRVWIYQADRALTLEEVKQLEQAGSEFAADWASHGKELKAAFKVFHDRFAVLFADESQAGASGCSIDSSVHFMQEMEKRFATTFFNRMILCYRDVEVIRDCELSAIPELVKQGVLTSETIFFDNLVQHKADLETSWQVPMGEGWTSRYFQ